MATWGDFIKEVPIVNKRSEGIFVKADHVLDLWEERNKLRRELTQARQGVSANPAELQQAADAEREACAREIEEMADALASEPEPNPQMISLLQAVARLLREKASGDTEAMASVAEKATADAPLAEALDADAPMAEPLEEAVADAPLAEPLEEAPMAEPLEEEAIVLSVEAIQALATPPAAPPPPPQAEPVPPTSTATPTLAELLQRLPRRPD